MDLSKFSDADLAAIAANDMSKVSTEALKAIASSQSNQVPTDEQLQNLDDIQNGPIAKFLNASNTAREKTTELLDTPAGYVRTGLADIASQGMDPKTLRRTSMVTSKDYEAAKQGKAPTSSEYLGRAGMEEGIPRSAIGFVSDIITDPVSYAAGLSQLAEKFPMIGKYFAKATPYLTNEKGLISETTNKLGEKIYKSGLANIDNEAARYGKEPVSDLLMTAGPDGGRWSGSMKQAQTTLDNMANDFSKRVSSTAQAATDAGGHANMKEAMAPLQAEVNQMRATDNPELRGLVNKYQSQIDDLIARDVPAYSNIQILPANERFVELPTSKKAGEFYLPDKPEIGLVPEPPQILAGIEHPNRLVTPKQAAEFKTTEYNKLPKGVWDTSTGLSTEAQGLTKTKARGLKESVENAIENTLGKDKADEYKSLNEKLGRILTTKKKVEMEAAKEFKKKDITAVDTMIATLGGEKKMTGLAAKKTYDVLNTTRGRTKLGNALMTLSEPRAKNQSLIRSLLPDYETVSRNTLYSPWVRFDIYNSGDNQ